jgi:uncharacterized protein (DUF488 family)
MNDRAQPPTLFTIGHSTHALEKFLALLADNGIAVLADIRSFPSSRKWPHFNQASLEAVLPPRGIDYRWLKRLGGRRHGSRADSPHLAWEHPAFRSYADYMESDEFAAGLSELMELARAHPCAIMCSEGLWWRCHRRIVSDRLLVAGWRVVHIMPDGKHVEHELTPFARVFDGRLIYDGAAKRNQRG